ncbi:MAG: hypothetical protein ACYTGT_07025 [Planctomycetota bacterium]|jgi:hypothetical protein
MNLPIDREFITQALIALGACLGGWMFYVQPRAEEVHALDAEISKLQSQSTGMSHEAVEQIAKQAPMLRDRCGEIEARSVLAQDTSQLYGQIMGLAKDYDVQVRNLRPGEHKPGRDQAIIVVRIDMTAEGEYEQLAEFLGAIEGINAYLRPDRDEEAGQWSFISPGKRWQPSLSSSCRWRWSKAAPLCSAAARQRPRRGPWERSSRRTPRC